MRELWLFMLFFLMNVSNAQPLVRYYLYPFNADFANPAATGLSNCLEINATDMHQWLGIKDAPSLQSFSIQKGSQFSNAKKQGLGLNLIRDLNGPSKSLDAELLYSFHVLIGRNRATWLSFGLSGNFGQHRLDERGFYPIYDPLVTGEEVREISYNASGGFYIYNVRYFAGFALYNLLPVNKFLSMGYGADRYFMSVQGGYLFAGHKSPLKIQTSFQGNLGEDIYQFDLNNRIRFENNLWIGLTLRKYAGKFEMAGQNAIVFMGYDWNSWSFCYSYNFDINGTQFHHYGTHQLSLGFRLCPDNWNCPAYK